MGRSYPYREHAPEAYQLLLQLTQHVHNGGLERRLLALVSLRAAQLNGCAFCVDMHARAAIAAGETTRRLNTLVTWRETSLFSPRERAALEWTEVVTRLGPEGVPQALFDETRGHFSDKELTDLTYAVAIINAWNRICVTFQPPLPDAVLPQGG
jgi:AhpD family alkylhydroperoxidase